MPTARESLLDAAHTAITTRPWSVIRMVDVAAVAGVSRQTLYNEFGSKQGLGSALVARAVDLFLAGAERTLRDVVAHGVTDPVDALLSVADWVLSAVDDSPLLRAVVTGCWNESLPVSSAQPTEVLRALQRRVTRALAQAGSEGAASDLACAAVLRFTLSYVVAPSDDVASTRQGLLAVGRILRRGSVSLSPLTGGQQPTE